MGVVVGPSLGRMKFTLFMFAVFFLFVQRSSGFTFGDNWRLSSGFTFGDNWRLSIGFTFGDFVTFSVIQLSVSLRVARCRRTCPFWFHPSLCIAQGK